MRLTVNHGDTLYGMLRQRGIPENQLEATAKQVATLNNLDANKTIFAGSTLEFPSTFTVGGKQIALSDQVSLAQDFAAQTSGQSTGQPLGTLGVHAFEPASGSDETSMHRTGLMLSNTFWGQGEGIYSPNAKFNFDSNGSVSGWKLAMVDGEIQRVAIEGKYNSRALSDTQDNPAKLTIKANNGEILSGTVALLKNGDVSMKLDGISALSTEPDLGDDGLVFDLVKAPLYGENPGGAYGHPSRFDFDTDGTVAGWRLEYDDASGDISREPFHGKWQLEGDRVSISFDQAVDGKMQMQGRLSSEGLILDSDDGDKRFNLGHVKDPWEFFDA